MESVRLSFPGLAELLREVVEGVRRIMCCFATDTPKDDGIPDCLIIDPLGRDEGSVVVGEDTLVGPDEKTSWSK